MEEITRENLEQGRFIYRDSECEYIVEKGTCGHYFVIILSSVGVAGMHYDTIKQLRNSAIDIDRFTFQKFHENEILAVEVIDES